MKNQIKKVLNKVIILLAVICTVASCGSGKNKSISDLDERPNEVDLWIKSNHDEILQLREYFKTNIKDRSQEQMEFNKFTPFQKRALWAGKILEVLEFDWTDQEKTHLQSLLVFMVANPIFSEEKDPETLAKVNNWGENWGAYAIENLGWNHNLLHAIAGTLGVMLENKDVDPKFK